MGIVISINESSINFGKLPNCKYFTLYALKGDKYFTEETGYLIIDTGKLLKEDINSKMEFIVKRVEQIEAFCLLKISKQDIIRWAEKKSAGHVYENLKFIDDENLKHFIETNGMITLINDGGGNSLAYCPGTGNVYEFFHEQTPQIDVSKHIPLDKFLKLCEDLWEDAKSRL